MKQRQLAQDEAWYRTQLGRQQQENAARYNAEQAVLAHNGSLKELMAARQREGGKLSTMLLERLSQLRTLALQARMAARLRAALVAVLALATGTAVAQTGLIAFVGLAAPHLVRAMARVAHRQLM